MLEKRIIILVILLASLLAISAVNAAENATDEVAVADDTVGVEDSADVIDCDDVKGNVESDSDGMSQSDDSKDCAISSKEVDDVVSYDENNDILDASPPYSKYSVSVSDTTAVYKSTGTVTMKITSASGYSYKYDFYLKIYDSSNNEKVSQRYYSTSTSTSRSYTFTSSSGFTQGTYAIKIINSYDSQVMATAKLYIVSVPYNEYSVKVSDTSVDYGSSGKISMSITPASGYSYKYDYYLKVYDSNNVEKISQRYSGTSAAYSKSYSITSNLLDSGTYTIKILNNVDNHVMATARLVVKTVPYSAYSVSVSNTTINYGSGGSISMAISPASAYTYKYDYYLKVYDSSNTEKISKKYFGTDSVYSQTYSVASTKLAIGAYTIKIINCQDNQVMGTATLNIVGVPYSAYSVKVSNTTLYYGSEGSISMTINPASGYYYSHDFYIKVYDSANKQKVSKRYYGSGSSTLATYSVSSSKFDLGNYTIKILNNVDNHVMATARLYVKTVPYSAYSVDVSDTSMEYGNGASISMSISPASAYTYKYDYFLKVYDSKNAEKISQRYYATSSAYFKTYSVGSTQLAPGTYTIKILNNADGHVMDTAKLTVRDYGLETGDSTGRCDGTIHYKVRASDNGVYKSGISVIFNCNGEEYSRTTDSLGYATLDIHLKAGTYEITTKCGKIVRQNTIQVNRVYVSSKYKGAYVKSLKTYYKSKSKIKYGWKGNLEGYFKIYKGKKLIYKTKLNSNGYIDDYFSYSSHDRSYGVSAIKKVGTYKCVITNKKGKTIAKATVKIKKAPTRIKTESLLLKVGAKKTVRIYVYDKSGSRKNIAGTAKVKINGKTYKVKVKKGFAKIKKVKLPLKVKTYRCSVKFSGNKNYKASFKKFKIWVRKYDSMMQAYAPNTKTGARTTIVAYVIVKDFDWNYLNANSGYVKFKIAGSTYKAKVKNGVAKITITAPSKGKTFHCKAVYTGSKSVKSSSSSFTMKVKKPVSKYKIITTTARYYWIHRSSGAFTVETKIWDMTAGFMAPYKYIDTTLYKYGRQVANTKYSVKYQINGRWTGWAKYGTVSTAHHRFAVPDGASVGQIKVKFNRYVNPTYY